MDYFETISKRGSYRSEFKDQAIPEDHIRKILMAGIKAPSGYNMQTTTFIALINEEKRKKIAELVPTPAVKTAPLIIVVLSEYLETQKGLYFEAEDYAAATENIMLAVTAMGYAGVWMDGMMKLENNAQKVKTLLDIQDNRTVRTIIPVGIPKDPVSQKEKKEFSERAVII